MPNSPVEFIVAAFNSPERAGQVMADLKQGKKEGLIGIVDAAVVVKDADGKLKITDSKRRGTRGFFTGGVLGGVLGLLIAPPVGAMAVSVGALGALIGRLRGLPLRAEMKDIGSSLTPNSSAIAAIIEHTWVPKLEAALAAEGARVVRDSIQADIAEQLNAGGSVLYTSGVGSTAAGAARVVEGKKGTQVSGIGAGESGVLVGDAQITDEEPVDEPVGRR